MAEHFFAVFNRIGKTVFKAINCVFKVAVEKVKLKAVGGPPVRNNLFHQTVNQKRFMPHQS